MKTVIFDTPEAQARGLQHLPEIPADTLYIFPFVDPWSHFHSRNVAEPFDIAFLTSDFQVIEISTVTPPRGGAAVPAGTAIAVESKAGTLQKAGFEVGKAARF